MAWDEPSDPLSEMFSTNSERRTELRHAVMLGRHGEQRSATRSLTTAQAVVYHADERHIGLVRDLSSNGLFIYSDFTPELGTELKITVRLAREKEQSQVLPCAGKVVRVESPDEGAAVGLAVRLEAADEAQRA